MKEKRKTPTEKQKKKPENKDKLIDIEAGISVHLDIIIPVKLNADADKLKKHIVGEFEGVPVVDGEAYKELGEAAEQAVLDNEEVIEILGEILSKAYVIKIRYPNYDKIEYLIDKQISVIR